jgi:BirA family transcriptional regulator, biotin operon repressor / biotin---[acetyl-CoA-carboxylase] ligase
LTERVPDDITSVLALYANRLGAFAHPLFWHEEITSTNDVALRLADEGAPEGLVIAANMQTAGRGRQGRIWASPPAAGLYFSTVLRPPAAVASVLTLAAGVAMVEGIRESTGLAVALKWPNDVYVSRRKLAGILAEAGRAPSAVNHVVVGCGINLLRAAYPPDVAERATSLEMELGRSVERGLVLAACLAALAERYGQLTRMGAGVIVDAWRKHAAPFLGRRVDCVVGLQSVSGVAHDVDDTGALLVRTESGVTRVISGEVSWK